MAYWIIVAFLNQIEYAGTIVASICLPAFSVGLMNACRTLDKGESVSFGLLFSGFQNGKTALFVLGGIYLAATMLALWITSFVDGGTLLELMTGEAPEKERLQDPNFVLASQVGLVLMIPVVMAFWFAPLLVAWNNVSIGRSLFFSFFASLQNWKGFLTYALGIVLFGGVLPGVLLAFVITLFSMERFTETLFVFMTIMVLGPSLVASFYISYQDVFGDQDVGAESLK